MQKALDQRRFWKDGGVGSTGNCLPTWTTPALTEFLHRNCFGIPGSCWRLTSCRRGSGGQTTTELGSWQSLQTACPNQGVQRSGDDPALQVAGNQESQHRAAKKWVASGGPPTLSHTPVSLAGVTSRGVKGLALLPPRHFSLFHLQEPDTKH